jgi:hypothetical protein
MASVVTGTEARRNGWAETVRLAAALLEAASAAGLRPAPLSAALAMDAS